MVKRSWTGFLDPKEAVEEVRAPTVVGVVFIRSLRGMVRLDGWGFG